MTMQYRDKSIILFSTVCDKKTYWKQYHEWVPEWVSDCVFISQSFIVCVSLCNKCRTQQNVMAA